MYRTSHIRIIKYNESIKKFSFFNGYKIKVNGRINMTYIILFIAYLK